ncbi:MAG: UbiA family prenyltransferase [Deltaproteobacteria bacterium]|nr:UbiA family prenyltransferase [Deltaproteobacteria bacterium]
MTQPPQGAAANAAAFARDIKLSHSIFALPFALAAAWIISRGQTVPAADWAAIVVAMVGARSSAMGINRIADRHIDKANPRTVGRELAAGRLSLAWAWALTLGSGALFCAAAGALSPLALGLSPLVLLFLWGYSFTKRFTALCHLYLGLALGLSPICVWIALTGGVAAPALLLSGVIASWVAGFDMLYALQDRDYDRGVGLHSVPAAIGEKATLVVSGLLHLLTVGLLAALPAVVPLGGAYWLGVVAIGGLLGWEHAIVRPGDLSRMNAAFFTANSWVSVIFLGAVLLAA